MAEQLDTYITRIAWNGHNWEKPSGLAARMETGTYVTRARFGHEEWLNRDAWHINGWRYGFLQGVNKAWNKRQNERMNIRLFAINPASERVYVGEIRNAQIIDE